MKPIPVRQIKSQLLTQTGRFTIRDVQALLNGGDMVHHLHKHDFFFVLALEKGQGMHEIDFFKYSLQDYSIFILRPGQVHQLELKSTCTGWLMEFDPAFYQPRHSLTDKKWRKALNKNVCQIEPHRFMKLLHVLSNIAIEYTQKEEGYLQAITAHLDLFFLDYVRQSRQQDNAVAQTNNYMHERFEELVDLLETHIVSMKNVSEYAELLSLSAYQLNAITKASVGKTVSDLINEQIVLEAKRYLLATSQQVKEIADHLGYEDVSYFIRFFKKQTTHSPEEFRRNFT